MREHGEPYPTTQWGRDLDAVLRGQLTFDDLFNRHGAYVTKLVRPWEKHCPPYMTRDDYRQEIWSTVHDALEQFDPAKKVPLSGWVGWRIRKRMQRIAEKGRRANTAANAQRYRDYLIVEERVVASSAKREDGMLIEQSGLEPVTQPNWEVEYDAQQMKVAAMLAMPNARSAILLAKIFAGAQVKDAAPTVFKKLRRPNKAAHRAIAQARAAVETAVATQTLAQPKPENDNTPKQDKLRPIVKVRRADSRERTEALAAR